MTTGAQDVDVVVVELVVFVTRMVGADVVVVQPEVLGV